MLKYHMISFLTGFLLDIILGDPYWLPHPIRLIGNLIAKLETSLLEKKNNKILTDSEKLTRGKVLVITVCLCTGAAVFFSLSLAFWIHNILGVLVESVMVYQILATKCLKKESMKVYSKLKANNLDGAREAVSMIVGRDTVVLDEIGITKATIETVAENCSDGVIAPMLYLALGGPVLGFLYKAVNTMDSMVGYKNETYLYFGRAAAKLDDWLNYIPSRISAGLMIIATLLLGKEFSGKQAYAIFRRDRFKHASPNSAQTESVCAGALGIELAGDTIYFGEIVKKPYIGDANREVLYKDIIRVNQLLYVSAFLCEGICLIIMLALL